MNDYTNLYLETFNDGEKITIDWGDGNKEEYVSVREEEEGEQKDIWYLIKAEHTYAGKSSHTVIVRGKIKSINLIGCKWMHGIVSVGLL